MYSLVGTKHYLLDGMLNQTLHNRLPCVSTMSCSVSVVYRAGLDTAVLYSVYRAGCTVSTAGQARYLQHTALSPAVATSVSSAPPAAASDHPHHTQGHLTPGPHLHTLQGTDLHLASVLCPSEAG